MNDLSILCQKTITLTKPTISIIDKILYITYMLEFLNKIITYHNDYPHSDIKLYCDKHQAMHYKDQIKSSSWANAYNLFTDKELSLNVLTKPEQHIFAHICEGIITHLDNIMISTFRINTLDVLNQKVNVLSKNKTTDIIESTVNTLTCILTNGLILQLKNSAANASQ